MQYLSPAKINLFLRVLGRRDDGYHELATLMQAIGLFDTLDVELADHDSLTCTDATLPTDDSNLVIKAAKLFRERSGVPIHIRVHLTKNIPHQAGLGGGSSNAATTLWAMNELAGRPATLDELIAWSGEIGSDITFFLSRGTAYCTGRGEKIRDVHLPHADHAVVLRKPDIGLATGPVFKALEIESLPERDPLAALAAFEAGECPCFNDLEGAAMSVAPEIAVLNTELRDRGLFPVLMSGAGSTVFGLLGPDQADLPARDGDDTWTARFVNRDPQSWYSVS